MKDLALAAAMVLTAVAQAQPPEGQPEHIAVTLSDFRFAPTEIVLRQGHPYVLDLVNSSERPHTFTAARFFERARLSSERSGLTGRKGIVLAGGASKAVSFVAPPAGLYELRCTEVDHVAMGMTGRIRVR